MSESPRRGEHGVSILGALVVALMLGAGSIATFELATPSLSSISPESQTASSHEAAARAAAAKKAAEAKRKEEEDRKKAIEQKCKEAKASLAKEKVGATTRHTPKTFEKNADPVEPSRCVGAIKTSDTEVRCVGLSSDIKLLSNGQVRVTSKPDSTSAAGKCGAKYCSFELNEDKKAVEKCSTRGEIDGYKPLKKQARENDLQTLGPNAKNNLINNAPIGGAEGKALADALRPDQQKLADEYEKAKVETKGARDAYAEIKCVADDVACKDLKAAAGKDVQEALKREEEARKRYADLSSQIKRLEGGAGPPDKDGVTIEDLPDGRIKKTDDKGNVQICDKDGKNCTTPTPGPGTQNPGPGTSGPGGDSGASNSKGGGMGDIGSLLKSLGSLFGKQQQQPQMPCVSDQNQYNQQLQAYQMQLQSYNQQLQQYNYARQLQSAQGSTGFTPEPPTQPAQPCYKPSPTNSCQQAPAQPDPSQCQNGSWKPTYTGACLSGWQCVPSSGSGTGSGGGNVPNLITAILTCQPQVVDVGMSVSITYSCSSGTSEGGGFETGGAQSGSTTVAISSPPQGTNVATFGLKCTGGSTGATKQCNVQIGKPGIVLIANPKNVKDDKQTAIGWVTSGMKSCVISSDDLPQFTSANANKTNVNGTVQTPPLDAVNGSTTSYDFLLHCITVGGNTKDAALTVTASI